MFDYFSFIKPLLYKLNPEIAHNLVINILKYNLLPNYYQSSNYEILNQTICGLNFKNPVGLAAGFDKNADGIRNLSKFGFGFIETGTVTLRPQDGNPKPRLFRLEEDQAIINRLGFNNKGIDYYLQNISKYNKRDFILGANIGKNKDTLNAQDDYTALLRKVSNYADYVTINISSPNTPGLRNLQNKDELDILLSSLNKLKTKPIFLKIAPDLNDNELIDIAETAINNNIDAIIIGNTTISSKEQLKNVHKNEVGGLSGKPLFDLSTNRLSILYKITKGTIPLIGAGGIFDAKDTYIKIKQGASLVQMYSSLIYNGFGLVEKIKEDLAALLARDGFNNIKDAIGVENK